MAENDGTSAEELLNLPKEGYARSYDTQGFSLTQRAAILLKGQGWRNKEIATRFGVTEQTVSRWVNDPRAKAVLEQVPQQLARALDNAHEILATAAPQAARGLVEDMHSPRSPARVPRQDLHPRSHGAWQAREKTRRDPHPLNLETLERLEAVWQEVQAYEGDDEEEAWPPWPTARREWVLDYAEQISSQPRVLRRGLTPCRAAGCCCSRSPAPSSTSRRAGVARSRCTSRSPELPRRQQEE